MTYLTLIAVALLVGAPLCWFLNTWRRVRGALPVRWRP
jgi:hypothetical protein